MFLYIGKALALVLIYFVRNNRVYKIYNTITSVTLYNLAIIRHKDENYCATKSMTNYILILFTVRVALLPNHYSPNNEAYH